MTIQNEKFAGITRFMPAGICLIGAAICLVHFFRNPSFWLDEAYLASDLMIISFSDIFKMYTIFPLQPRTPMVFQLIVKTFSNLFGQGEMAYRLWPLLATFSSMAAFSVLLKKREEPVVQFVALALFVFNPAFFYYAVELKPYASDALATLLIYLLFERTRAREYKMPSVRLFAFGAALVLFASYPSVFVSLGIIFGMLGLAFWRKDADSLSKWARALLIYSLVFIFFYGSTFSRMVNNGYIIGTWAGSFLPYQEGFSSSVLWLAGSLVRIFDWPLPMTWPFLGFALFLFGAQAVWSKRPEWGIVLLVPIGACLFASCLQLYPFNGRMLFFLLPNICLIVAIGFIGLARKFRSKEILVVAALFFVVFLRPIDLITEDLTRGISKAENRKIYEALQNKIQKGDIFYYNNSAQYSFVYYFGKNNFYAHKAGDDIGIPFKAQERLFVVHKLDDYINIYKGDRYVGYETEGHIIKNGRPIGWVEKMGRDYIDGYWQPQALSRQRVWLIFSHFYPDVRDYVLDHFNKFGQPVLRYSAYDAEFYLYQMGEIQPIKENNQ